MFNDRVAIVTGAGKGIGQATAIAFSRLGAMVVLSGQSKEPLMEKLALIASQGVRVNTIAPGSIETPLFSTVVNSTPTSRADYEKQTPMGRIAKSEEVAAAATWLCSDAASYVTGAVVPVDGGMTL